MTDDVSRRRLLATLGVGFGTLAGCGYRPGGGDIRWTIRTGSGPYRPDFVLATGDRLFTVTRSAYTFDWETETWGDSGSVTTYDGTTGEEQWQASPPPLGRPAAYGDALYVGHDGGELLAFGTDGTERWRKRVGAFPQYVSATAERVYAVTTGGHLVAFETSDGSHVWEQAVDGSEPYAVAAASDGVFLTARTETSIRTVTAFGRDGTSQWSVEQSGRRGRAAGRPVVDGETVYLPTDRGLVALAVDDGDERWSHERGPSLGTPTVSNDTVYYTAADTLYALQAGDGEEQWTYGSAFQGGVESPPAVAGDTVYVGGLDEFSALAAADGTVRWQVESESVTDALAVGPTAVAATESGTIRAHWRENHTR